MAVHAFIFPGQGSQAVGMGRDLAAAFSAARAVFDEVDETLKQKLSKLMFEGPGEELQLTENAQPALMAVSLAVLRVLEAEGGILLRQKAVVVAGHSLGEYSALAAAGAFSVADAARLLKLRGQAMQKAVPAGEGAMAALLGNLPNGQSMPHLREWLKLATPVREIIQSQYAHLSDEAVRINTAGEENVLFGLENLHSYHCVQERLMDGSLRLHGWFFKIATAELFAYDPETKQFLPLGTEK